MNIVRLAVILALTTTTSLPAQEQTPTAYAGGSAVLSFGAGWSFEESRYNVFRLGLQFSGTNGAERPVETTGEMQLLGVPDGGGASFYAGAGANVIWPNGAYAGPAVGFFFTDQPLATISARVGIRPRSVGFRPEIRMDYIVQEGQALLMTVSLGLEVH